MNNAEKEFQQAAARRQFAQAVAQGRTGAIDRFGQRIQVGDQLMLRLDVDHVYSVTDVRPVLDPKLPPGLIDVLCTITFPLRLEAGLPYAKCNVVARRLEGELPGPEGQNGSGPEDPKPAADAVTPPIDEPPT